MLTTNKPFKQWANIFNNDSTIASALLERLLHYSETNLIEGISFRMKDQTRLRTKAITVSWQLAVERRAGVFAPTTSDQQCQTAGFRTSSRRRPQSQTDAKVLSLNGLYVVTDRTKLTMALTALVISNYSITSNPMLK